MHADNGQDNTRKMQNNIEIYDEEDVMMMIKILSKQRQKITQRGRLSEAEDAELHYLDGELDYWRGILDRLLFEPEEDDEEYYNDNDEDPK
jgi:hypothetical protein